MQSSLHISPFTFRTEKIPKLKFQNSKSSPRIPQSLNLFPSTIYDSMVQQSTTDTLQQPSSFLFFHHPRHPFHQPPWEPESTQQQWRLSSLHQVSYSVYLFHLLQKFIGSLFSVGNYQPTSARGAFFFLSISYYVANISLIRFTGSKYDCNIDLLSAHCSEQR